MLWGMNDVVSNAAPTKQIGIPNQAGGTGKANASNLFHNTTPNAIVNGQIVGLYGVTNAMSIAGETNTAHQTRFITPGWTLVKQGMGPILSISVGQTNTVAFMNLSSNSTANGGTGYNNTDQIILEQNNAGNAVFNPVTNSTGGILSLVPVNVGYNWQNTTIASVYAANSTNATSASNTSLGSGLSPAAIHIALVPTNLGKVGAKYSNTELIRISNGVTNAVANLVTDGNGSIVGVNNFVGGSGFINATTTVVTYANSSSTSAANTANGVGGNLIYTFGGRAGRIQREVLVVGSTMSSVANTPAFPNI